MKFIKYFFIIALVALVIIQFIRPERNIGSYESVMHFEEDANVGAALADVMKNNCYDCHSNHTQYPWYAEVAPISFWMDEHVEDGKGHFNVSEWSSYSAKKKDHKLEELIEFVEEGEMPLPSYTWLHGNISKEETQQILQWAKASRLKYQREMAELAK